jgi:phage gpG-like protein
MADKLESDIQRMKKEIEQLISRKLPVVAGKYAKQHFQDNFRQGGFVNGGLHPWPPAKRLSSGESGADSQYKTLMSSRNHLFSSINYTPGIAKVTIFNDVVYAAIHNEGGTVHPKITPKMRRFAWAKYYELNGRQKGAQKPRKGTQNRTSQSAGNRPDSGEAEKWKRLALTKKETLTINIPQRQFMGQSTELDAKISAYVEKEVLRIINS